MPVKPPTVVDSLRAQLRLGPAGPARFSTRVVYLNSRPSRDSGLREICERLAVARNLRPIMPYFLPEAALQRVAGGGGDVGGTVKAFFFLDFADPANQWESDRAEGTGRTVLRFYGGNVFLSTAVAVFVDDRARVRRRAFESILGHELDHVVDERTVLGQLATEVPRHRMVNDDLVVRNSIDQDAWESWYARRNPDQFTRELARVIRAIDDAGGPAGTRVSRTGDRLAGHRQIDTVLRVQLWTPRHNTVSQRRDSGPEYMRLGVEIGLFLQYGPDADLMREFHGPLPDNVG